MTFPSYFTIKAADGTIPASLSVMPNSVAPNVFLGKFVANVLISNPSSSLTALATSNSVVSTGKLFMMVADGACSLSLVSAYAFGPSAFAGAAVSFADGSCGSASPLRAAFSISFLRARSFLSRSIWSMIFCLASASSFFSRRLRSASLAVSRAATASRASCDSRVALRRISSLRLASSRAVVPSAARLAARRSRGAR